MSFLQKYLNENHEKSDNVKSDLLKKFGVNIRQEGDFFLFKYGMISCNWQEMVTHESRGSILKLTNNGWEYMSRPFNKFFNQHEGHCPIFPQSAFEEQLKRSVLVEKADGSCIQLWNDGSRWRVSTLGTITPLKVQSEDFTFSDLFFRTVGKIHYIALDPNFTYLFELCCDENRIVTQYTHNHAVYIGSRDRRNGRYLTYVEMDYEIKKGAFRESNVRLPHFHNPNDHDLKTLEDVKGFVDRESNSEQYGKYPEGFIVYDMLHFHPIAKMKNARYMSLHHVGGGDIAHSKNQIINAIFLGYLDDVYDVLSDRLKEFANKIKEKATQLSDNVYIVITETLERDFSTRKEFASFIMDKANKKVHQFFFKNANSFMDKKNIDFMDLFDFWLKENYQKFDWKE